MFCGHCGKEIEDNAFFCSYCGNRRQEEDREIQPPRKERKKHKGRKKIFIFVIIMLVVMGGLGVFYFKEKPEILIIDEIMELFSEQQNKKFEENEEDNEIVMESEEESSSQDEQETEIEEKNTDESTFGEEESEDREKELMEESEEEYSSESVEIKGEAFLPDIMVFTGEMSGQLGLKEVGFLPDSVVESSHVTQTEFSYDYTGWSAFDHDLSSSWQEGADEAGIGEYVGIDFGEEHQIKMITLALGNHRSERLWGENNIPKCILVEMGGKEFELEFPEEKEIFAVVFPEEIEASDITITIKDVYMGTKYPETAIAEIGVWEKRE